MLVRSAVLPFGAIVAVVAAIALWSRALAPRDAPAVPVPPDAALDASPPDAIAVDAFDLRGEVVALPAGVKFIVPPRAHYEWVTDEKKTLVFGEGEQLMAIVNVTSGKKLRNLVTPRVGVKAVAQSEKLEVTSVEEYAPGRVHAQLDGERRGVQRQQHLIFISLPTARVTIWLQLEGTVILDPRLGELLQELRMHRVVL